MLNFARIKIQTEDDAMMQAMIFAAGLGTRLKPLTYYKPKALVEVGERSLLEYAILRLKSYGFTRIVVNVHHFSEQIIDFLSTHTFPNIEIIISDESNALLDTGGGLRKAVSLFDKKSPILIHNVDIFSNENLGDLWNQVQDVDDALLLVSKRNTSRFLLFDEEMRLVGWWHAQTGEVKSPYKNLEVEKCRKYAFSGIHIVSPNFYPLLLQEPEKFGIIDFYLSHCANSQIRGIVDEDLLLFDVGKIDSLNEASVFAERCGYFSL